MADALRPFVERLLRTHLYGGRCVARDEHTLLLYDVPRWTGEHTRALQSRFPECEASCEACAGSMSGFIVIVRAPPQPAAPLMASLFVLALAGVAWTARVLLARLGGP